MTNLDGTVTKFMVKTDKKTVGEALLETALITGDPSDYGLYVTSVNGLTADWATENAYWAFYINGEYAQTGVDTTDITAGATYSMIKTISYTVKGEGATKFIEANVCGAKSIEDARLAAKSIISINLSIATDAIT